MEFPDPTLGSLGDSGTTCTLLGDPTRENPPSSRRMRPKSAGPVHTGGGSTLPHSQPEQGPGDKPQPRAPGAPLVLVTSSPARVTQDKFWGSVHLDLVHLGNGGLHLLLRAHACSWGAEAGPVGGKVLSIPGWTRAPFPGDPASQDSAELARPSRLEDCPGMDLGDFSPVSEPPKV